MTLPQTVYLTFYLTYLLIYFILLTLLFIFYFFLFFLGFWEICLHFRSHVSFTVPQHISSLFSSNAEGVSHNVIGHFGAFV